MAPIISAASTAFDQLLAHANAQALSGAAASIHPERQPVLNGAPYRFFRQSVSIGDRRQAGTFFSSRKLARELAGLLLIGMPPGGQALDPTCGIGDLVLAYAELLPLRSNLVETLVAWGEQLAGIEKRDTLVAMAKTRLIALARSRGGFNEPIPAIDDFFPHIVVGDMFDAASRIAAADGFLFNPPFGRTCDYNASKWGTGKRSAAAVFLDALIAMRKPSAPIAAVLPEVLRCGSCYARFRSQLADGNIKGTFKSHGRFDAWTDVDVFTTLLVSGTGEVWTSPESRVETIGDRFVVRVGPVVPHRHPNEGRWQRFICARSVPAWSSGFTPKSNRRFKGTLFKPPFVVVRRTSSPSDRKRAVGAIILGDRPVAVENHLIVLIPNDKQHESCVELLSLLASDTTSDHLNRMIRCRHLTTGSVMAIPWTQTR